MKKKLVVYMSILLVILTMSLPCVPAHEDHMRSAEVYASGWMILSTPHIEGVDESLHLGGAHDLNFSVYGENTFILRTRPIWGSTIISDYVDLHIVMINFFGIIDVYGDEAVLIGICKDVSWEKI